MKVRKNHAIGGAAMGAVLATIGAVQVVNADVIYEGFGYGAGTLVAGSTGGTGFSSPWSESGGASVRAASGLTYTNGATLVTSGGAASADVSRSSSVMNRLFAPGVAASGEVWVSFLVNVELASTSYGLLTVSGAGGPTAPSYAFSLARVNFASGMLQASVAPYPGGGAGAATAAGEVVPGTTCLIVGRIAINGTAAADTASLWLNPRLDVPLGAANATLSTVNVLGGGSSGTVRFELGSRTSAMIDEIRIGTTAGEVMPLVPGPGGAVLVGVAGCVVARRRRT